RFFIVCVANYDICNFFLEIDEVSCKAEYSHDLTGHCNIEAIFSWNTACYTPEADVYLTQCAVIHIHDTLPGYATRIDIQFVAVMQMIVDECSQCIVGSRDCMEVTVEVEVDLLHRQNLCVTASSSAAFSIHDRTECRFTEFDQDILCKLIESICQTDSTCWLPFPCRCRVHGGYQYHFGFRLLAFHLMYVDFCLMLPIHFECILW